MELADQTTAYIKSLLQERSEYIQEIEAYAQDHDIPIMELDGMETMLQFLRIQQPKLILEIGTAIGYSAIRMMHALPNARVISLERDQERALIAKKNVAKVSLQSRFDLIQGDALELAEEVENYGPFDVLFIDAAKGQYERFFSLYEPMVKEGGVIFSDNVLFKGMIASETEPDSRGLRAMVRKIRLYNENLMNNPRFDSMLLPVGDGLMISRKNQIDREK
ncbi:O-methyltransferase [Salipaludibacillus sp. HK11]|uniref:O-methyltransferase n=1 Tax=Salipaludibacillus sp. HK11 TaxID=3394320 RepID=UPI0039FD79B6